MIAGSPARSLPDDLDGHLTNLVEGVVARDRQGSRIDLALHRHDSGMAAGPKPG